jgi:putative PIN family toxin of toxin-antitoxin system
MPSYQCGERLTERKDRVVVDTGVLISAFVFGGIPEKAVKKAFAEADLYISRALLKEYREVPLALEREGKIAPLQLKALISGIASFVAKTIVVYPRKKLSLCRDPEDNMLLECCLASKADFLITGDKDLLDMQSLPFQLAILSPRKFMEYTVR